MTFSDIVSEICQRLNLTSSDAITRVGLRVNDRHRRVSSTTGLITSRLVVKDYTVNTTTFPTLPDLRLDMEKVLKVRVLPTPTTVRVLRAVSYDEISALPTFSRLPELWAVKTVGSNWTIITLDSYTTTDFTLSIDGYKNSANLADNDEPLFPEDYHDILVEGAMSDELRKMEKPALAQIAEAKYEARLSDLRMFLATNAYTDIFQGKTRRSRWFQPWFTRTPID